MRNVPGSLTGPLVLRGQVVAHAEVLPFSSRRFNGLRGGLFALVLWASLASAVVSVLDSQVRCVRI